MSLSLLGIAAISAAQPAHAQGLATLSGADRVLHAGHVGDWRAYVADDAECPGAGSTGTSAWARVRSMKCLINYARTRRGLRALRLSRKLLLAARLKSEDIQRCRVFDHAPCGGSADAVAGRAGYSGAFGENLFIGERRLGSPRTALRTWLASRPHRENLFSRDWRVLSAFAVRVRELAGFEDATLWVLLFGDH